MFTRSLVVLAAALTSLSGGVQAQTTFATITGTVVDATGAVVPNAQITVTSLDTNQTNTATSNDAGIYTIPQLREGAYTVMGKAAGFQDFRADQIVLAARDIRRIHI